MFIHASDLPRYLLHEEMSGKLYWRSRTPDMFRAGKAHSVERICQRWNVRFAGQRALKHKDGRGYFYGQFFGRTIYAHRAIWALAHGEWPEEIDHINGDPSDNRIANLRNVEHRVNCKNQRRAVNNTSGVTGVTWNEKNAKWLAVIHSDGVSSFLGLFNDIRDARAARKAAEASFGFHPNHGSLRQ